MIALHMDGVFFFISFYTFEVMTHSVVKESFLKKYLATLFEYTSCDLNIVAFYHISTFYIMNYRNCFTKTQCKKNAYKTKMTLY